MKENKPVNLSYAAKDKRYLLPDPIKHKSRQRESLPLATLEPKSTEEAYFKHKQNMEDDKINLMRRLNAVLLQLDQANAEKQDIELKLEENVQKVVVLENQLNYNQNSKEDMDENMQVEIQNERESNSHLNRDIKKFEHERDMLKDKLKEQEEFRQQLNSDSEKLTNEYHLKTIELKRLEEEFVEKQSLLTKLERELESMRNYHNFSKGEKSRLEEEVERLTIEKKRLIASMKREKNIRKSESREHLKTLSSKLLFYKILEFNQRNLRNGLKELRFHRLVSKNQEKGCKRIEHAFNNQKAKTMRTAFRRWFNNSYDFKAQEQTLSQLVDKKADNKQTSKFFFMWRSAYFESLRKYDDKMESITRIKDISHRHEELLVRKAMCEWRKWSDIQTNKVIKIRHLLRTKNVTILQKALANWIEDHQKTMQLEKYETLKVGITGIKMRQKVFYAWKLFVKEEIDRKDLEKFYEWKNI